MYDQHQFCSFDNKMHSLVTYTNILWPIAVIHAHIANVMYFVDLHNYCDSYTPAAKGEPTLVS